MIRIVIGVWHHLVFITLEFLGWMLIDTVKYLIIKCIYVIMTHLPLPRDQDLLARRCTQKVGMWTVLYVPYSSKLILFVWNAFHSSVVIENIRWGIQIGTFLLFQWTISHFHKRRSKNIIQNTVSYDELWILTWKRRVQ